MEISEQLMVAGVAAHCADCGDECLFVPVDAGCVEGGAAEGCEYFCTRCDAAVFLLDVLDNTGSSRPSRSRADRRGRFAPAV